MIYMVLCSVEAKLCETSLFCCVPGRMRKTQQLFFQIKKHIKKHSSFDFAHLTYLGLQDTSGHRRFEGFLRDLGEETSECLDRKRSNQCGGPTFQKHNLT